MNALGDFNGDGMTDILWRHTGGMLYTWMMNGASAIGVGSPGAVDLSWSVVGAADFGGDGKADILWRHTGGMLYLWEMNGISALKVAYIPPIDVSWQVKALADFNGDGKADILSATHRRDALPLAHGRCVGHRSWFSRDGGYFMVGGGRGRLRRRRDGDILWRHTDGALYLWEMDGITPIKVGYIPPIDVSWR